MAKLAGIGKEIRGVHEQRPYAGPFTVHQGLNLKAAAVSRPPGSASLSAAPKHHEGEPEEQRGNDYHNCAVYKEPAE
jgi:hypothetical protein